MKTVAFAVQQAMKRYPLYGKALQAGVVNVSSLGRELQGDIENILMEPVTHGAIVIALKRYEKELQKAPREQSFSPQGISIRNNLTIAVFRNSPHLQEVHRNLLQTDTVSDDALVHFAQGTRESSFVISDELQQKLKELTAEEKCIAQYHNLTSLSVRMPSEIMEHVGVFSPFVQLLAWQNISVYQVMSYFTEITFVIAENDAEQAFAAIKSFTQ